jgi:hypothetical protein
MSLHPLREPALLFAGLLAPLVQTGLLIWGGLSPQAQAVWNAATLAVAGVVIAALTARDKLAPAVLGLSAAVVALLGFYGWHLSAAAETALASTVALVMAAFLRTQITAPIDEDGRRAGPPPAQRSSVADLVARIGPKTAPIQRIRDIPGDDPVEQPVVQVQQPPTSAARWYAEPNRPGQEGHGMRG